MTYIIQANGLNLQTATTLEEAKQIAKEMLVSKSHSFKKGTRTAFIFSKFLDQYITLKD